MIFGRRRFRDVVGRQLMLFAQDHDELVQRARASLRSYSDETDPAAALERYADFEDASEDIEDLLYDMCDRFSSTLDEPMAKRYAAEFDRQARKAYRDVIPRLSVLQRPDEDDAES